MPSKYINVLGEPILRWKLYAWLACILSVCILSMGVVYIVMLQNRTARSASEMIAARPSVATSAAGERSQKSVAPVAPVAPEKRVKSIAYLSPLERVLEKHLNASNFDELSTYFGEGTFGLEPSPGPITLMARAPKFYKFKTEYSARSQAIEFGFDGKTAWLDGVTGRMTPEQAEFFTKIAVMEISFLHLAWSYRSKAAVEDGLDTVLELLPSASWNGRACAVLRSFGILPLEITHYIDLQTSHEIHREAEIMDANGEIIKVGVDFDAPDPSAAYGIPMGYQIYVNGKLHDRVKLTKVRTNQVMLSSLFKARDVCSYSGL